MTNGPQNPEARAAWCAQMREFIDLVESTPEIPIPYDVDAWAHLQPHYCELTHAQRVTVVHDFADRFGACVIAHRDGGRQAKALIGTVEVIVHAYPDKSPLEEQPRDERVVSREQDASLMRHDERGAAELPEVLAGEPAQVGADPEPEIRLAPFEPPAQCTAIRRVGTEEYRCTRDEGHWESFQALEEPELVDHFNPTGGAWPAFEAVER